MMVLHKLIGRFHIDNRSYIANFIWYNKQVRNELSGVGLGLNEARLIAPFCNIF